MKSIIITGGQAVGKSTLARELVGNAKAVCFYGSKNFDEREIEVDTKFIVIEEVVSEKDIEFFKMFSSKIVLAYRKPYSKQIIEIDVSEMTLIGVFQTNIAIPIAEVRHGIVFNLTK